jgi:PhzF family phenazine biosynthesis protein
MGLAITQVDSFSAKPFGGNPAAVCLLDHPRAESWMQIVAREMNLSETAFLVRRDGGFDLRWFTPTVEVDLCGHATLASAHVLWEEGHLAPDQRAHFHTKSGVLAAEKKGAWIEMDFPATPVAPAARNAELETVLGVAPRYTGRSRFDYFIEVASEEELRALQPNFTALRRLETRGIIVTSRASGREYDFVSRFFAPACGIDEDPATGSAHCALGPFWTERLGRDELLGYQASARGGFVRTKCIGRRVLLSGQAVTVMRAELLQGCV